MGSPEILFSIITPSGGKRPNALANAVHSVARSMRSAGLNSGQVEMLVGFDGIKGKRPVQAEFIKYFDFRPDNDWGNGIRNLLLKISKGRRILFLDDDNALKPSALTTHAAHMDADMVIARIDVQLAHDMDFLPIVEPGRDIMRQCNVDPLCCSLSRKLVVDRCEGWGFQGRYEADFLNLRRYYRRAGSVRLISEVVGIYDMGRGLDKGGLNFRQADLLDDRARISTPVLHDATGLVPEQLRTASLETA